MRYTCVSGLAVVVDGWRMRVGFSRSQKHTFTKNPSGIINEEKHIEVAILLFRLARGKALVFQYRATHFNTLWHCLSSVLPNIQYMTGYYTTHHTPTPEDHLLQAWEELELLNMDYYHNDG
jgi:hypothetical protein